VWSAVRRALVRFVFCYIVLSYVDFLRAVSVWFSLFVNKFIGWVMVDMVGVDVHQPSSTGSGDTVADYLLQILILIAAVAGSLIWSLVDRRPSSVRLRGWLQVLTRYALAFWLIKYGFAKVIPTQFLHLQMRQLTQTYGQSSPMGLLWNFMGFSTAYTVFAGIAELLPAMLLLFRRTALSGALIAFGVLLNVAMLNFCYDVPVKLFSLKLLLLSLFLILPESGRLLRLFVLNRPVPSANLDEPRFADARVRRGTRCSNTCVFCG
jgi:hypothetical protein